jgi:hypothetical protein
MDDSTASFGSKQRGRLKACARGVPRLLSHSGDRGKATQRSEWLPLNMPPLQQRIRLSNAAVFDASMLVARSKMAIAGTAEARLPRGACFEVKRILQWRPGRAARPLLRFREGLSARVPPQRPLKGAVLSLLRVILRIDGVFRYPARPLTLGAKASDAAALGPGSPCRLL